MEPSGAGEESESKTRRYALLGTAIGAVAIIIATLIEVFAQSDPLPEPSEDRQYYEAQVGCFKLEGEIVWRANGEVAASASKLAPAECAKAVKCRSKIVSIAMSKAHRPLGDPHIRSCEDAVLEDDSYIFGHIEYSYDASVSYVLIIPYWDGKPTAVIYCPHWAPALCLTCQYQMLIMGNI